MEQREYDEVHRRARHSLRIAEASKLLLDIALAKLTLGKNAFQSAKTSRDNLIRVAERYLNEAVQGLIEAGAHHHLPRGFLARSQLFRVTGRYREAWRDLEDMLEVTDRGEMKLFLAEIHLEAARIAFAENDRSKARERLNIAAELVNEIGYTRRLSDVELIRRQLDA